ncbi:amino acid adenylation domain-containing protein [Tissierella sp.]|uniref:amino acid adenylation domain-containing protein n=1 Tax=Tissierella sp. TaxID=41274 RepID=UPI00305F6800
MDKSTKLFNLTEAQKRIWYTQMINPELSMFVIGGTVTIYGNVDIDLLRSTIKKIISVHDAFQIRLIIKQEVPLQFFAQPDLSEIEFLDFSHREDPEGAFKDWVKQKSSLTFALENTKLYEFVSYKIKESVYGYFVKLHHIIADGWSFEILNQEIKQFYEAFYKNETDIKIEIPQYKDYLLSEQQYIQSDTYEKNKKFWNEMYAQLPENNQKISDDTVGTRTTFYLSQELTAQINKFCNNKSVSLNAFFITIYLLFKYIIADDTDICVGVPVLGRSSRKERKIFGMFVSTMAVRFLINEDWTILQILKATDFKLKECYKNQKYPYNNLVKDLNLLNDEYRGLYSTCVNYYGTQLSNDLMGMTAENFEFYNGNQEYSLQIVIRNWMNNKGYQFDFDYKSSLYSYSEINDMFNRFTIIIKIILSEYMLPIKSISLLSKQEENGLIEFNSTKHALPACTSILDLFTYQVRKKFEKEAIRLGSESLSYGALDYKSDQVAAYLYNRGIGKNDIIALLMTHSIEIIIVILGIMKAGSVFLPIDIHYPIERINFILQDSGAKLLFTDLEDMDSMELNCDIISPYKPEIYEFYQKPDIKIVLNDLVYVIYTSGSSGSPKGVMVEHGNLLNYICYSKKTYVTQQNECFALYSSFSFDLTITSIFTPLVSGGTILIYNDDQDEYVLNRIIKDNLCTVLKVTPSHLHLLKEYNNTESKIEKLIVGGEMLYTNLAKQVFESFGEKILIYNEYGPTETTVGCMVYQYNPLKDKGDTIPIGKPIDNMRIYILNKNLRKVPIGSSGEICIAGAGVTRGYLGKAEITNERFISSPFLKDEILYKTGDLGKFIDLGTVEYLGRKDFQIKVRGYRIELEEIERCIQEYNYIEQAVVVLHEDSKGQFLCTYYVSRKQIDLKDLRRYIQDKLPYYMVPDFYQQLDMIPVTINGKVDKNRLQMKRVSKSINSNKKIKENGVKTLLYVMQDVLGIDRISIEDNFYYLGGDSIKAIQISSRLREKGYTLKVKEILINPLISDMLTFLSEVNLKGLDTSQKLCMGNVEVTPIIRWFISKNIVKPEQYCQEVRLKLNTQVSVNELEKILLKLIDHHDGLRLNYNTLESVLYYENDYKSKVKIVEKYFMNLTTNYSADKLDENSHILKEQLKFGKGLLLKSCLYHMNDGDIWSIIAHHFIIDGVSWRIILENIQILLDQIQSKKELILPRKTISYQQYASYVYKKLTDGKQCMSELNHDYQAANVITEIIDLNIVDQLSIANETYRTKNIELLLAALIRTISKLYDYDDVFIEIEGHGRDIVSDELDISNTVGWFTHLSLLNVNVKTEEISDQIVTTKEAFRAMDNKKLNYDNLYENLDYSGPYIRFNFLGDFKINYNGFVLQPLLDFRNELTADIEIDCVIMEKELKSIIHARDGLLSITDTQVLLDAFQNNLKHIINHCCLKEDVEISASDFENISLTQSDLDSLFK